VDDFVIVARPAFAAEAERLFNVCLADIGLPISAGKADEAGSWSPAATWIGFHHDADALTHALPERKKDDVHKLLRAILSAAHAGTWCSTSGLRALCGKLSHVATVFTAGRAFLRRTQAALALAEGPATVLDGPSIHELEWWLEAIELLPTAAAMRRAPCTECDWAIVSDASLEGQGAVLFRGAQAAKRAELAHAHAAFSSRFSTSHPSGDMTLLEAWALWTALRMWADQLRGAAVWAIVDNESLRWAIKKGRSKSPRVNSIVRAIMLLCLQYDIQLFPDRVQTELNVLADELSRWDPAERAAPGWASAMPAFRVLPPQAPRPLATKYDTANWTERLVPPKGFSAGRLRLGRTPDPVSRTHTARCSNTSPSFWWM